MRLHPERVRQVQHDVHGTAPSPRRTARARAACGRAAAPPSRCRSAGHSGMRPSRLCRMSRTIDALPKLTETRVRCDPVVVARGVWAARLGIRSKASVPTALARNPSSAWNVNESCVAVPGDSTYTIVATSSTPVAMLAMLPWAGARSITSCSGSWLRVGARDPQHADRPEQRRCRRGAGRGLLRLALEHVQRRLAGSSRRRCPSPRRDPPHHPGSSPPSVVPSRRRAAFPPGAGVHVVPVRERSRSAPGPGRPPARMA